VNSGTSPVSNDNGAGFGFALVAAGIAALAASGLAARRMVANR
jgi:hypothetical protein